jgi:carbon-monoxide dehydrogenase iron sulfur subunit
MSSKILDIIPANCTGCKECEVACSMIQAGVDDPELSRIRILNLNKDDGFYLPTTCQQCEEPPCLTVCPEEAISRDEELGRVIIDNGRCIGCRMCFSACPIGAIGFDDAGGRAFKCDLCGGNPECVRVCEPKALDYVVPYKLQYTRMNESANKLYHLMGKKAA